MLNIQQRSRVLHDLADRAVPDTIDLWPALNARLTPRRRADARRTPRWVALIAAAAMVVAIIALGVVPWWSAPEAVSAETILDRAETAASTGTTAVSTYHLLMTRVTGDAGTTTSEVWFGGPDRQRTIQQVTGPNGASVSRQDVVFNGPETWIEDTQNGVTRVIHTTGTTWTKPADAPAADPNLPDLLRGFGDKTCMAVRLEQAEASVAGQATYVIVAAPKLAGCAPSAAAAVEASPGPAGAQPRIRVNGQPAGGVAPRPTQLTVWVDKRSFLPLRMEVRDAQGVVVDRSEVTRVEYNVSIADATFAYTPPPGVAVATFNGGNGADVKRLLASDPAGRTPPGKAP
jgi:outer membrane lipoprotein-sorting protein